jgi:hypothetical protein
MSTSAWTQSTVVLLTLVAIAEGATGHDRPDVISYNTGYTAVPTASYARALMAPPGTSPRTACANLLNRRLLTTDAGSLTQPDFVGGCTQAIADAME